MKRFLAYIALASVVTLSVGAVERQSTTLTQWQFARLSDGVTADNVTFADVRVPHDWAINEPFDRAHDLQVVAVEQNGETEKTCKTGRTGGLPYFGRGVYRTTFAVADTAARAFTLIFDGAMSNPVVCVNGREIGRWAYGYNSFYLDIPAGVLRPGDNALEVSLENKEESSRWYPGAGLFRNVHLLQTAKVHVAVWGTYVTTPSVSADRASVSITTDIA